MSNDSENERENIHSTPAETASGGGATDTPARPTLDSASDAVGEQNAVFPFAQKLDEEALTLRDELTKAQSNATEAARLSGDHFTRLLYGPDADRHLSPYGVPPTPNSLDSRKP